MSNVLGCSAPFKVFYSIIMFDPIFMIHLRFIQENIKKRLTLTRFAIYIILKSL